MSLCEYDLKDFKIQQLPGTAYYIPQFINHEEEDYLLRKVYSSPKPKWKDLSNRRLQNWGGLPHPKGMIQEPLPDWLNVQAKKIAALGVFGDKAPNHVLVNEYQAGQGIMPHEDGPLFYPTITTLNIGSHTVLDYYSKMKDPGSEEDQKEQVQINLDSRYIGSLLLERCSLLIVQDDLYHNHLHGIKEMKTDCITNDIANLSICSTNVACELVRDTRISLTIRHVPRVLKTKCLFGLTHLK